MAEQMTFGGVEAVVTFDGIETHTPRGRHNVELHLSFLRLHGQANNNDFEIPYTSVARVFWLPKSYTPHTFVVLTLDPPIRNGEASYTHIVMQFGADDVIETTLRMSEDIYNSRYKDKLQLVHKGLIHQIFVTILSGLSDAKVTRPGRFRSCYDSYAVKSSLETEDGYLYILEDSLFFLPNPPILILHEEIDYVEFERHSDRGSNMHYFDFLVRLKTQQEHVFRNISKNDYHVLFTFTSKKGLKILNLGGHWDTDGNDICTILNRDMSEYKVQSFNFGNSDDDSEEEESSESE
ncbi:FACT complex subunit ssrp1 [Castilleja foliolosa]|uniref:FACT complex subunit SSRP1 n=1 Tax=Castilleja foliolosa TaxID=1961234 RepID=A0ABD3CIU6_9LAMI